jgi:pimeloyl-ACP methyl ester carboxylesterase
MTPRPISHGRVRRWLGRRTPTLVAALATLLVSFLFLISLAVPLAPRAGAQGTGDPPISCAPAPTCPQQQQPLSGDPVRDNIYYGAVPPGGGSGPVLVFVHGLGGLAQDWWGPAFYDADEGNNDMYVLAYSRGYRTAFVTLNANGERSPGNDFWVNGKTLAQQIAIIADRYGVDRVDVIAHSKGGIDIQAAIVGSSEFTGIAGRVRNVFTLSTPHQGSELAEFAVSEKGQSLINNLNLPFNVDGALRSLTPDNMRGFRDQVDPIITSQRVRYFTAAGTDWGPQAGRGTGDTKVTGLLRISGPILQNQAGANDGLVSVVSSKLTGLSCASVLFIQPNHHFNILFGRYSFPWIHAAIQRTRGVTGCQSGTAAAPMAFLAPGSPLALW